MSRFSLNLSRTLFYDDLAVINESPEINNRSVGTREELACNSPFSLSSSITVVGQIDASCLAKVPLARHRASQKRRASVIEKRSLIDLEKQPDKACLEMKESDEEPSQKSKLSQHKGTLFILLSALGFSCSNVVMKRSVYLSPSDHSVVRYVVSFLLMVCICMYNDLKILGPRSEFKLLCLRGLVGSLNVLCVYFSIMFLNPSDATTLMHVSIIFTSIVSRLFLGEKLTLAHFVAIILTANGVLFISKPSFLFSKAARLPLDCQGAANNCTAVSILANTTTLEPESFYETIKPIIGIGFAILSAIFTSMVFFTLKKLSLKKVHWATCTIYVCLVGMPLSVTLSAYLAYEGHFHQNVAQELDQLPMDIYYSVLSSLCSLSGQVFLTKALMHEEATKIAIIKTIDVFFACLLQYFLLGVLVDYLAVVGSCSILLATITIMSFKIIEKKYMARKQNKLLKYQQECKQNSQENKTNPEEPKENLFLKLLFVKL